MAISRRMTMRRPKKPLLHRIILGGLALLLILALMIAFRLYQYIFKPNVNTHGEASAEIFIPTGSDYQDVTGLLFSRGLIIDHESFTWVAGRKNYPANVKPGRYLLDGSMNNNTLINMLRSGAQTPVKLIFNNIRLKEELAQRVSLQIEADSASLMACWNDREFLKSLNTTPELVFMLFIPNTYEFWWNTDACAFTRRMHREQQEFWNAERTGKAERSGLSIPDIVILASIVEKETQKNDEKPSIAGVYLNRLRKGWPLQADPTLVFASGDFELKRVLNKHKEIESPYNTYKYTGLPPGPICLPSVSSIEAVLDYRDHDYMFFCAKDDLSGYHVFSRTLREHNRNASRYQQALNRMNIKR